MFHPEHIYIIGNLDNMINKEKNQNIQMHFMAWVRELKKQNSFSSTIDFFVKTSDFPILYFEYQSPQAWLSLKHNHFISITEPLCFRLHESDASYEPTKLYNPKEILTFHSHIKQLLGTEEYQCFPLIFNQKVIGIFTWISNSLIIKDRFFILNNYIKDLLWREKWARENNRDELTGCLNGKSFLKQLFIEFSRARRLQLPLSLILIELDQMKTLESVYGTYKPEVFIKTLTTNLIRDSRAYDIFGFWPKEKRLGIILPHTAERGAGMKAEKIRWSVQSSNFSKVFPSHPRLTLSLALGEYPRVSRSADSLFRSTLKALSFAFGECGGNMTTVATPPVGFKPDFAISQDINHLRDLI